MTMRSYTAELVLDARAQVAESPRWDVRAGRLVWVDVLGGAVHLFDPATGLDESESFGVPVGAAALRASGSYVVAVPGAVLAWHPGERAQRLLTLEGESDGRRINDAACDPAGRLLAGTMSTAPDGEGHGRLYSLSTERTSLLADGIGLPNGIDWSPDGRTLYFTDSLTRKLDSYPYDPETGAVGELSDSIPVPAGLPDGHTVDAEGNIWVALWSAGQVACLTPSGRAVASVTVPVQAPTSCAFGGPDLSTLYITTMPQPGQDASAEPLAGGIFACQVHAVGRHPYPFTG
ncbi:SMP-30/gluconolactonase/LRE family protein [Actinobacteria bacterium YIM 96077]|uniref:SMP-30/gluconolactonase/LRE family protein n=1 Tax=Phytoactinopolyspora halophila TaxID=1981511 RepID=A0A329QCT4_9ACTN|nr:SMP-30/gluconolactonase/LRE family protein [Phytoactinopolyspora halophila]AYY13938.1 SMP-30/gluconolactonase/LRE family protein [Actinobacteria bacterium YIM 96077]RAW10067.1 SMP-30/gluconolactonase/LRE family protein [Phytoactinopolyspora halophila]